MDLSLFGTTEYIPPTELDCILMCLTPTNRLVARVCLETGLRIGDVVSLRRSVLSSSEITVVEQKTRKTRTVTLSDELRQELIEQSGEVYVFENTRDSNKHRTRQALWHDIKRCAHALRLDGCIAPHSLRKVYAVRKYSLCGNLVSVQNDMNHSSLGVTAIYALADGLRDQKQKKRRRR